MKKVLYIGMLCEKGSTQDIITAKSPELDDSSGKWFEKRLAEQGLDKAGMFEVDYLNIAQGDSLPPVDDSDGGTKAYDFVVLGGTFFDVMGPLNEEGRKWQRPLQSWLLAQRQTGQPLLGICGGHQAMTVATGGEVTHRGAVKGSATGSLAVGLTAEGKEHPLMQGLWELGGDCAFHFGNGDEVSKLPAGATALATSADSPAIAIDYGGAWASVQFHPEASHTAFQHWVDCGVIKAPSDDKKYRPLVSGRRLISNFLGVERADVSSDVSAK